MMRCRSSLRLSWSAFDVVLCDLMMPGMSGMELHAWIGAHRPTLLPRVVFVTGGIFTDEAKAFVSGIPNATLAKPFSIECLQAALRSAATR